MLTIPHAAHLVMIKISVCRDPKTQVHLQWSKTNSMPQWQKTQLLCLHVRNSIFWVQSQLLCFLNPQNYQPISSGHDVIHTPALSTVWGLLIQWWLSYPLLCFVLRHINLICNLMPNQVKEYKYEKSFDREVLGFNDKLEMISWLFVFSLLVGNHDKKTACETGWGWDQFVRIYLVKKGFIEVIWYYCKCL